MTRLISEEIEPTFARIIGVMFARCEAAAGDDNNLYFACNSFWWAVIGMEKIAIAVRGRAEGSDCLHLSIATSSHVRMAAEYIKGKIGIDPMFSEDRDWKH